MTRLFVANWKMNCGAEAARRYSDRLARRLGDAAPAHCELVVAPPFTAFAQAADVKRRWALGAQNVAAQASGAYTGEVSAAMVAEAGCRYVIVGHSERRRIFGEGAGILDAKLARAREAGLVPIYCVGETEAERSAGREEEVLSEQLETLADDPADAELVVAYEPVWAIGSGQPAMPGDARAARDVLVRRISRRRDIARVRLLYGGSVTAENAGELLEGCGMDGFLIGGASLDPDGFADIAGIPLLDGSSARK